MYIPNTFIVFVVAALSASLSLSVRAQDVFTELAFASAESGTRTESVQEDHWRGFLGAGTIALDHPVADRQAFVLPLVSVSYRDTVYWSLGQAGVWLLKSDDRSARLGLAVKARGGYDPEDYDGLVGMEKRHTSVEAGLNGKWWTRLVGLSFGYFTDVTDKSNGNSAQLGLSHSFRLSSKWSLTPSVGAEWLSDEVVNYYYGVRASEAIPGRPAYTGQSTVNLRGAMMVHYKMARAWSLFGGASITHLGTGMTDSPIIIQDNVAAVFVGAGWHF